jgi:sRNA-binding protein
MTSPNQIDRQRGIKEAGQQLEVLRERWPLAFPVQAQDVRPLAMGVANQIAEIMGWSLSYSVGVLTYWKMSAVYCRAVLDHDQRITLDGTPVEAVDEVAKDVAAKQLTRLALRERREADRARQSKTEAGAIGMVNESFAPPSSKPGHWDMDSENTKQHDNHVQRDDGHEQDDENPQNG